LIFFAHSHSTKWLAMVTTSGLFFFVMMPIRFIVYPIKPLSRACTPKCLLSPERFVQPRVPARRRVRRPYPGKNNL
jgi:hypothetical protein